MKPTYAGLLEKIAKLERKIAKLERERDLERQHFAQIVEELIEK